MSVLTYISREEKPHRIAWARLFVVLSAGACATLLLLFITVAPPRVNPGTVDTVCASNLRRIYEQLQNYAINHGGRFPPNLTQLVGAGTVSRKDLQCPLSTSSSPPTSESLPTDYFYFGNGMSQH